MKIIWKYLTAGVVKHQMASPTAQRGYCGITPVWYLRSDQWLDDPAELRIRRECKMCAIRRKQHEKELETEDVQS